MIVISSSVYRFKLSATSQVALLLYFDVLTSGCFSFVSAGGECYIAPCWLFDVTDIFPGLLSLCHLAGKPLFLQAL